MPVVWRGMRMVDGKPEVGRGKTLLGVLVDPAPEDDIPDENGEVKPNTGRMSVSPSADRLPLHRLPRRLRDKYPERFARARGTNTLQCWWMGEGPFVAGTLAQDLLLRLDPDRPEFHGFVEPERNMMVADYESALAATGSLWTKWEE